MLDPQRTGAPERRGKQELTACGGDRMTAVATFSQLLTTPAPAHGPSGLPANSLMAAHAEAGGECPTDPPCREARTGARNCPVGEVNSTQ